MPTKMDSFQKQASSKICNGKEYLIVVVVLYSNPVQTVSKS